jgi:hypothetical protein
MEPVRKGCGSGTPQTLTQTPMQPLRIADGFPKSVFTQTGSPGDSQSAQLGWTAGTMEAIAKSADLKKTAARWQAEFPRHGAAELDTQLLTSATPEMPKR